MGRKGQVWPSLGVRSLPCATLGLLALWEPGSEAFIVQHPGGRIPSVMHSLGLHSVSYPRQRGGHTSWGHLDLRMLEGKGEDREVIEERRKKREERLLPSLLDDSKNVEILEGEGPFPSLPPDKATQEQREAEAVKTEMWKELWQRNVANNAAAAGHHTSLFMTGGVSWVSKAWELVGNKINLPSFGGFAHDYYEEVLIDNIAYDADGQGQIVEYDPAFLSRVGWATNLKGTVFNIASIYWQFCWLMGIATIYALLSGPAPLVLDTMGNAAPIAAKITFRLPSLKAQTFAVSLVGGLLTFLLSLFNSNGLDRWWKTRDCLGVVIGRSIDLTMMFAMYIRGYDKESDEIAYAYKCELVRYLNLAHILVYRQANSIDDLSDLIMDHSYNPPRQWITHEEMLLFQPDKKPKPGQLGEAVRRRKFFAQQLEARPRAPKSKSKAAPPKPATGVPIEAYEPVKATQMLQNTIVGGDTGLISRYCVVYYWVEELLSKASREGLIDSARPEALWKMQESVTKMRGSSADVFMYLYCKIPYIYVHLMTVLVKVYLIVIAAVAGSSLRMSWFLSRPADFAAAILMVFFMNLVYEGLLQIHIRLWNPLGFDINDYPQRRYQDYVWRATMQFLKKPEKLLPKYMIPKSGLFIPRPPRFGEARRAEEKEEHIEGGNESGGAGEGIAVVPFASPDL